LDVRLSLPNLNRVDEWIYQRTPSSSLDADPVLCIDAATAARAHACAYIEQKKNGAEFWIWPEGL
jgi:hypothetical protein